MAATFPVVDTMNEHDASGTLVLYTIPETADRLRCSESHVYRLIDADVLRAVDIAQPGSPSKTRVRSDDLADYIESRTR